MFSNELFNGKKVVTLLEWPCNLQLKPDFTSSDFSFLQLLLKIWWYHQTVTVFVLKINELKSKHNLELFIKKKCSVEGTKTRFSKRSLRFYFSLVDGWRSNAGCQFSFRWNNFSCFSNYKVYFRKLFFLKGLYSYKISLLKVNRYLDWRHIRYWILFSLFALLILRSPMKITF